VTGSQIPLVRPRSDGIAVLSRRVSQGLAFSSTSFLLLGISNFLGALLLAGTFDIPEVQPRYPRCSTFDIPEVALSEIHSRDAAEVQPRCSRGAAEV